MKHKPGGHNTADNGTCIADQRRKSKPLPMRPLNAEHECCDNHTHAEGSAQVSQRGELILLEAGPEPVVVSKCENGGVVGEICGNDPQCSCAGQTVEGAHQWREQAVDEVGDAKLREEGADCTGQNGKPHNVKHGID